jgi:hypothetical protein
MSQVALVIGNGESRSSLDLKSFIGKFYSYGCNAGHRDFSVDKLFCYDKRMALEFLQGANCQSTVLYTNYENVDNLANFYKNNSIRCFPELPYKGTSRPDQPRHWNSGQYALLCAAYDENEKIYITGFDLYSKNSYVNNIYKDTANYSSSNSHPVDHSYWLYQNAKIFSIFQNKSFILINEADWKLPQEWEFDNVSIIDYEKFSQQLQIL